MNKKTLVIIIVVIIVIVVGVILFRSPGKPGEEKKISPVEQGTVTDTDEINKIMTEVVQTQDASLCAKLADPGNRKACENNAIIAKAGIKQDSSICDQIAEDYVKTVCKDNVIITKALNTGNPGLCDTMVDKTRVEQCKTDVTSRMQNMKEFINIFKVILIDCLILGYRLTLPRIDADQWKNLVVSD